MERLALFLVCLLGSGLARPSELVPWSSASGRIIDGTDVDIADYPWQVSFQIRGQHNCGASIISSNWVLTAAHCVEGYLIEEMSFRVGSSVRESGGNVLNAASSYVHENYNNETFDYDIAVVQVSGSLLGTNALAVDLPSDGYDPEAGLTVSVTGWGRNETGGPLPSILQKVDISVWDRSYCQSFFRNSVTRQMVCAGDMGGSVCNGDSGGPLVSGGTQVGIVSWGARRCESAPALFSNVGRLRSWVQSVTGI